VPTALIRNQRDTLRRYLQAVIEGIYLFKTRPKLVYSVFEEEGIKEPAVQKDLQSGFRRACANIPSRTPTAFKALWIHWPTPTRVR
jgi:hypothetical protein